jgi:dipeptidyl-peptidase-4
MRCLLLLGLVSSLLASDELNHKLKRIFDTDAFQEKRFGPSRWIKNGAAFTTLESSAIIEHDTAMGRRTTLIDAAALTPEGTKKPLVIDDYQWSRDSKKLLIFTETKKVWRQNTRGDYWVLDRGTNKLKKIGGNAAPSSLMFAKFSPDGGRVAYVRANNIYVEDLATGAIRALTSDGSDTMINGTSDWVYEEELNLRDGYRWSPDGRSIAFWNFDTTGVEQFSILNNTDSLYPSILRIPYPKAGTKNSAVKIGVVSAVVDGAAVEKPRWMELPGDSREHYLFRLSWVAGGSALAIGQLNRKQNTATIFVADPKSGASKVAFRDTDETWVDVAENEQALRTGTEGFEWLDDGKRYLWLSDRDGWRHAYSAGLDGSAPKLLTPGDYDVISTQAIDPNGKWIYFLASAGDATQRMLYRASVDRPGPPVPLTPSSQPGWHQYDISPDNQWALHSYSRFDRPPVVELIRLPDHQVVRRLEDNAVLRANAAALSGPPVEFLKVRVGDGAMLDGWLIKPPDYDQKQKYPLIVYVYGEPAGVTVMDSWQGKRGLFHRALASEGYLVASFDNRGTPAPKGRTWRKAIYGDVGVLSAQDQTEAVLAIARTRTDIDLQQVGVWGWSGGGSNTLNLMFRSPELFRVGVSVAPVPDQKLYDTIYQERYMGLPDENADGYRRGSPIHFAEGLSGKLLIVHGTGDDNVHYQGTENLINRLITLRKSFDVMVYPNRSHAISEGDGTSLHLHSRIARYFVENLPAKR